VRVLVVDTYYPAYLASHYAERPGLSERPYDEQLRSLLDRCFGTSDAYSHHLRELGHDAADAIVNCPGLQLRWAEENGVRLARTLRAAGAAPGRVGAAARTQALHAVARAQIDRYGPDVVYVQDLWFFTRRELDRLRRQGILVAGQIASPPPPAGLLRGFDVVFTSFPHFVGRFRALGVDSEYLKIAFYERVAERLRAAGVDPDAGSRREHAVSFVGGLNPAVHPRGTALLEALAERAELEVWGYGADALPPESPLQARHRGEAWGLDMYAILAGSRIVVNRHIDSAEGHANNMRLYEATAMGALLLTDPGRNLGELFAAGEEVVVYEEVDDLVEKARRYLEDEDERARIAGAGQRRTLTEHTYARRIAELAGMLEARL
jgi:hypothetical protein